MVCLMFNPIKLYLFIITITKTTRNNHLNNLLKYTCGVSKKKKVIPTLFEGSSFLNRKKTKTNETLELTNPKEFSPDC